MIKRFMLAASLALAAANASAAVHTYAFTASIDSLYSGGESLASALGPDGGTVALGHQLNGWFRFDDAAEPVFGYRDRDAIHVVWQGNAAGSFTLAGSALSSSGEGYTAWTDLTSSSPQWIDAMSINIGESNGWSLLFEDASGTVFSQGFPNGTLELARLSTARLDDGWRSPDGSIVSMYATLTSLAPVPEPETWGMLLAGLGMLGLAARRAGH